MVELVLYIFRAFHLIKGILNTPREWNICCTTHYKKKNKLQPFYHTERHAHCVRNSFLVGLVLLFAAIWLARCCAKTFLKSCHTKCAFLLEILWCRKILGRNTSRRSFFSTFLFRFMTTLTRLCSRTHLINRIFEMTHVHFLIALISKGTPWRQIPRKQWNIIPNVFIFGHFWSSILFFSFIFLCFCFGFATKIMIWPTFEP